MGTLSWQTWIVLISYGLIGISTSILVNTWWKRYYWASTLAAALSAVIFALIISLLEGGHRAEGEVIMIAFFAYIFFLPLVFATGAFVKLLQ